MMKKILSIAMLIGIALNLSAQHTIADTDDRYRTEADAFIASGAVKVQTQQTMAIREASSGRSDALNSVRSGRSKADALDSRVTIRQLTPTLRLYLPISSTDHERPLLLYLHGGGWCFGSIKSCSRFCTELCACADILVAALDYSLAPESPYPAAIEDCLEALRYLSAHSKELGIGSISIGGDSSGGNLAIVSALQSDVPAHSLLLFYPVTNMDRPYSRSWKRYGKGYALDADIMEAFTDAYIPHSKRSNGMISPLRLHGSTLANLPKTLLVAAERDVLYDQGKAFIRKLQRQHVEAQHITLKGSIHLFITVPGQDAAFYRSVALAKDFLSH